MRFYGDLIFANFEKHNIKSISFLFNNAHETEDFIVAGTRGWFWDEKLSTCKNNADFEKLTAREELRLRASLKYAKEIQKNTNKEILAFMHFPPIWTNTVSQGLIDALTEYGVKKVFYGHIHGNYTIPATISSNGLEMSLVSADFLNFIPKIIQK